MRSVPADLRRVAVVVLALHIVGFGLLAVIIPQQIPVGHQAFGIGLALTAYGLGARHALDPDHLAACDATVRKLTAEGRPGRTVGFYFSLGHSTVVMAMSLAVAAGAAAASSLVMDDSPVRAALGVIGVTVSAAFLVFLSVANAVTLTRLVRGDDDASPAAGPLTRLVTPLLRRVSRPWHIYPIGLLFGLGFDTATEIALLVLAGAGGAAGVPWYAIVALPILFTAGMTLVDTVNGAAMNSAYTWAGRDRAQLRRYNIVLTGMSLLLAVVIGTIQIASMLTEFGLGGAVADVIASASIETLGFWIVGATALVVIGCLLASSRRRRAAVPG